MRNVLVFLVLSFSSITSVFSFSNADIIDTLHIKNRQQEIESILQQSGNAQLLHYFADFARHNRDNPHRFVADDSLFSGVQTLDPFTRTPMDYMLHNPEKNSRILSTEDYLQEKLSMDNWQSGSGKNLPRMLIALLLEGDPEKMKLVNKSIQKMQPYTGDKIAKMHNGAVPFKRVRNMMGGKHGAFSEEFDDFSISLWTRLLGMAHYHQTITLDSETKSHIFNNLLKYTGQKFTYAVPGTSNYLMRVGSEIVGYQTVEEGIINSENHMMMINGSKYIRNQMEDPDSNRGTELEHELCNMLDSMYEQGFIEFNSKPYAQYTIEALLNLHDFSGEPVQSKATRVLDKIFYDYAIHSTRDGQSLRPFARQLLKADKQEYRYDNPVRAYMMPWIDPEQISRYCSSDSARFSDCALISLTTSYRPPQIVYDYAMGQGEHQQYLALTGHPHGNAEVTYKNIYTAESSTETIEYLLSGGGVRDNNNSKTTAEHVFNAHFALNQSAKDYADIETARNVAEVVPEPPTLILAEDNRLADSFFIGTERALRPENDGEPYGPGIDAIGHNNSGIYFDLMVGDRPVHVPEKYKALAISPNNLTANDIIGKQWKIYHLKEGLDVAVFSGLLPFEKKSGLGDTLFIGKSNIISQRQIGIVMVIPNSTADPQTLINTIAQENNNPDLGKQIKYPKDCASVIKDEIVTYNPYSALDRWIIGGYKNHSFAVEHRLFFKMQLRDGSGRYSSGWSGRSVIQTSPNEAPISLLESDIAECYKFLNYDASPYARN